MAKGLVIGILFGALLGAAAVRFVDRAHGKQAEETGAKAADQDSRPKAAPGDVDRLQKELATARGENEALQKKVGDLEAKNSSAASTPAVATKRGRWKDVGAAFFKMKDKMKDSEVGNSPEAQQAFMEMLGILGKLAKEYGVGLDEVSGCPEGIPEMVLSILDAAGVQPDAATQAAIDAAMNDGQSAWKDYLAKREDLSALERKRVLMDMQGKSSEALRSALSGSAGEVVDDMHLMDADFNFGGRSANYGGTRDSVAQSLTTSWAKDLGLDEAQKTALGPVVDGYMRDVDAGKADLARREAAGQKVSDREKANVQLDAMIKAQKRLGETMRLSEAQVKALKGWGTIYGYNLTDEAK